MVFFVEQVGTVLFLLNGTRLTGMRLTGTRLTRNKKKSRSFQGEGKITYTFSANANVLSANFPFSVLPAGGEGGGISMLAERYGERIHCFTPPLPFI